MKDRISREELVKRYNIEIRFFDELEEYGLISIEQEDNTKYLIYDELDSFERFANWHYDLDVNLPGLDILNEMMKKLEMLQQENRRLLHRIMPISDSVEDYEE